jgi:hypothetical protein
MLTLVYAGVSAPSARLIAAESDEISIARESGGEVNWGRYRADTRLNPDISAVTNKRVMRERFAEHGVPMPRLMTPLEAKEFVDSGGIVIGRPDKHSKGRGYWKCSTQDHVDVALAGSPRMPKKKRATHFMEYVGTPLEFRAHIFKGKSIRISEKAHTGFHEYTTIKPTIGVDHIRIAAKQAMDAVGLDFGAVDILADEHSTWVLEVNAAPGLGGSMPRVYAEAFLRWKRGEI